MNLKKEQLIVNDLHKRRFQGSMREFVRGILTPALSRRERENLRQSVGESQRVGYSAVCNPRLPLLGGRAGVRGSSCSRALVLDAPGEYFGLRISPARARRSRLQPSL